MTTPTLGMTKKAENIVGTSKAYTNRRSRKNKCNSSQKTLVRKKKRRGRNGERSVCDRCKQRKKLL